MWLALGRWLGGRRPTTIWTISLGSLALVAVADLLTGPELSLSIFYVGPVGLAAWYYERRGGYLLAALSGVVVYVADRLSSATYSHQLVPVWNAGVRLTIFLVTATLLSGLRRALDRERDLSSTDALTGVANTRAFYQRAAAEIERARRFRHPLTLAYLDLDNFKQLNDQSGHAAGDSALQAIAHATRASLRATDFVARLGGDEFAMLLAETDQTGARTIIAKLHGLLTTLMRERGWPTTCSIGVVTTLPPPVSVDELVKSADNLMYRVKRQSKNAVEYEVRQADPPA
jgi:diguanylate cyclase (GGDEF)-like protein